MIEYCKNALCASECESSGTLTNDGILIPNWDYTRYLVLFMCGLDWNNWVRWHYLKFKGQVRYVNAQKCRDKIYLTKFMNYIKVHLTFLSFDKS